MTFGHLYDIEYGFTSSIFDTYLAQAAQADNIEDRATEIRGILERPGVCMVVVDAHLKTENKSWGFSGNLYTDELATDFAILESLGLISSVIKNWDGEGKWSFFTRYYYLTELGAQFAVSCYRAGQDQQLTSIRTEPGSETTGLRVR